MKSKFYKTNESTAKQFGTMEPEAISKIRSSLKNLMNRVKSLLSIFLLVATVLFSTCKNAEPENNKKIDGLTSTGEAVMVMDTTMVSSKLEGISADGTLVFNNLAAEYTPEKGDIICSAPSKGAPQGFLYRVTQVTTAGNKTTIVTEFATIEEAVENADVNQTFDLTIVDIEKEEGVEVVDLQQTSEMQLRAVKISTGIKIDKKIDDNLHIKGSIELSTTVSCEIKIGFFQLNRFLLTTQPRFKAQLAATYEGKIEKDITFPITSLNCSPITFWAGIVPVVFTPKISIVGVLTSKGEVKVQATLVDWDYSYMFGIRYQNGSLSTVSENTSKPAKYLEDVQLILTGEMKLQPKLAYKYDLYNSGTYAGLTGNFYAKLKVEDKVGTEIKLAFSCGMEFGADAELKILSYKLGKLKTTFLSLEWVIWEKIWNNVIHSGGPGVYVVGYKSDDYWVAKLWKNGVEYNLCNNGIARSVYVAGNDVYVAGSDFKGAAVWKNGVVQNLGGDEASSIFVSRGNIYVAGTDGYYPQVRIAKLWVNGLEQKLTGGIYYSEANSVFVSGNDIYVAGSVDGYAVLWKNGIAQILGGGEANSVFVSGSDVYIVGGSGLGLLLWKNGIKQNLGQGWAKSVYVSGNDVYIAGYYWSESQNSDIATLWKNGIPQYLGLGLANSVFVSKGNVYVAGGNYSTVHGTEVATIWENGKAQHLTGSSYWGAEAFSVFVVE